ncbi:hypothetical protein [Arcticibacter sp. MXS-1]|uniref:hypothetical protein n=1 Tax=Arcticibacter sp. MXS-1 TaxID=3341726 RepID=UPI0035A8551D
MRKLLLYSALATLSLISACKKDEQSITAIRKMDDLVIPQGFDWSTTKAITFNVSVSDSRAGSSPQKLAIYEANPADGASPIATGFVSPALPYSEKIFFSSAVKQVYIVKTSSDGSSVTQVAGVRNAVVAVDFSEDKVSNASGKRGILSSTLSETFCDCSSADQITSDFSRDLSARDAGKTYCITKDGVSFEFNNNADGVSVIIKVCARNVKFDGKLINNSKIIITKGASVVMGGRFNIGGNASFVNYGTVVVPSGFSLEKGKEFLNYGSLTIGGDLNLNEGSAPVVNYEHAKLRIKGKLMINTGSSLLNYGKANFQNVQVNSSGVLENYCSLYVQETLSSDAVIKNSSFINVGYVLNENDSTKHDEGEGKTGFNSRGA